MSDVKTQLYRFDKNGKLRKVRGARAPASKRDCPKDSHFHPARKLTRGKNKGKMSAASCKSYPVGEKKARKARAPKSYAQKRADCLKKGRQWRVNKKTGKTRCVATVANCDSKTHKVVQLARGGERCMTQAAAAKYEAKVKAALARKEEREAERAAKAAKKAAEKARAAEKRANEKKEGNC